jgi:hypothetical protein
MIFLTILPDASIGHALKAHAAGGPTLSLAASGEQGRVTADLGEHVRFSATLSGPRPPLGEIAIVKVNPHRLLGNPCLEKSCSGSDTSRKAATFEYQALLIKPKGAAFTVVTRSNSVRVDWKDLPLDVKLGDVPGTLRQESPGSAMLSYQELRGVPVTADVTFPNGPSTAWSEVKVTGTTTSRVEKTCKLVGLCQLALPAPNTEAINQGNISVEVFARSTVVKSAVVRVDYRPWNVTVTGTNNKTGNPHPVAISFDATDTGSIDAKVDEVNSGGLEQYVNRIDIRSRSPESPSSDRGSVLATCKQKLACTYDVSNPQPPGYVAWAEVLGTGASDGTPLLEGRGSDLAVTVSSVSCSGSATLTASSYNPANIGDPVTVRMAVSPDLSGTNCEFKLYERDDQGFVFNTCQTTCATTFPFNSGNYSGPCNGDGECKLAAYLVQTNPYMVLENTATITITWP